MEFTGTGRIYDEVGAMLVNCHPERSEGSCILSKLRLL
jgi:hypothetical protein